MKIKILLLVAVLFSASFLSAQNTTKLPSIEVTKLDGEKVDISTLVGNGKIVVINFWATWCVPCKKELTNINEMYEEWQKKYGVEIIAVSIDDSKNTQKVKTTVEIGRAHV